MAAGKENAPAPPALKHGLTSQWAAAARAEEVEELAALLAGAAHRVEAVMSAARRAAEAILQLRQVRATKLDALRLAEAGRRDPVRLLPNTAQCLPEDAYQLLEDEMRERIEMMTALKGKNVLRRRGNDTAADALLDHLDGEWALLARLDDYERRALSRRAKALRDLDYERIEAERQATPPKARQAFRIR